MASAYVTGSSDILPARTANGCDIKATQLIKTDSALLLSPWPAVLPLPCSIWPRPFWLPKLLGIYESPRIR